MAFFKMLIINCERVEKQLITVFGEGSPQSKEYAEPSKRRREQTTMRPDRRVAITRGRELPPPQPKKFLGLVPRIFFYLFTFHSSLFTFLPPQRNFFGGNK